MTSSVPWELQPGPPLSISSGIDWLSCSAEVTGGQPSLFTVASARQEQNELSGDYRKSWARHGLNGIVCGDTVAAASGEYEFASVSGAGAHAAFPSLFPYATNVSRLDLAVTATWEPGGAPNVAEQVYEATPAPTGGGRPCARTILRTSAGGSTCYLGSRRSDAFGRVYDKGVEQGSHPPGTAWRFEVELKRDMAGLTALELAHVDSVEDEAAFIVRGRMVSWGYDLPWLSTTRMSPHIVVRDSDSTISLAWLRTGVAPTVRRLLSMGLDRQVRDALGLPHDSGS